MQPTITSLLFLLLFEYVLLSRRRRNREERNHTPPLIHRDSSPMLLEPSVSAVAGHLSYRGRCASPCAK